MTAKERFLTAVKRTILTSAVFHLVLLAVYAFQNRDLKVLNLFNILDLDLYVPSLIQGNSGDIAALTVLLLMLAAYYFSA